MPFEGIRADFYSSSERILSVCEKILEGRNDKNGERIAFRISGDGRRISAYSEETGYVFRDRLILDTCGYFINSCPNQEFCKEINPFLIPIQMGEKDAGEVLSVSRDVSEQYFREEDEAATMAEIGMM